MSVTMAIGDKCVGEWSSRSPLRRVRAAVEADSKPASGSDPTRGRGAVVLITRQSRMQARFPAVTSATRQLKLPVLVLLCGNSPYRLLPTRLKRGSDVDYDSNIMSMSCSFLRRAGGL